MRLHLSLFLLLILFNTHLFAQDDSYQPATVPEPLDVHFNQDFYATGEDIWYKIYVLHDNIRDIQSRIVRVEWLNAKGSIIENQALEITGNYAMGDFKIPYNWEAGLYTFRAYTNWSLNFGEAAIFTKIIPIFQVTAADTTSIVSTMDTLPNITKEGDLNIRFFTNKNNYNRREPVTLILDVRDANNQPVRASLSLGVTDGNFLPAPQLTEPITFTKETPPKTISYSAEKRFTVAGQLQNLINQQPISTQALSLYLPELKRFYRANSQAGKFSWDLPDFYTPTTLQVLNLDPKAATKTPQILLLKNNTTNLQFAGNQLLKSSLVKIYLHRLYQIRLANEIFKIEVPTPKFVKQINKTEEIPSDKTYSTDGFIKLRDVGEFIDEVILIARVNGSADKGNRSILLFNEETKLRFPESPIYMINGLITTDEKAVLSLPLQEIAEMKTYVTTSIINKYFDPLFNANGVLSITTKSGITPDFVANTPNQIKISGLYNAREFVKGQEVEKRSPLLRPTIYWDSKIITNEYGKANVTFPLTDTSGKVWIEIEGISVDGQRGKLVHVIEVK